MSLAPRQNTVNLLAAIYEYGLLQRNKVDEPYNEVIRLRARAAVWFHATKEHYRCSICYKYVDRELQRRSGVAALCVCRPREGR